MAFNWEGVEEEGLRWNWKRWRVDLKYNNNMNRISKAEYMEVKLMYILQDTVFFNWEGRGGAGNGGGLFQNTTTICRRI